MTNQVTIEHLSIKHGDQSIVSDLSLTVDDGEFIVLLGPSGCGKSTLLNAIAGLLDVSEGRIFISQKDVTHAQPKDRGLAMVFQSYALYPTMTAGENLAFALKVAGLKKTDIKARVDKAAKILQLEPLLQRKPSQLSGGQRQRVAIGRALVREKGVLLFDEPLSNLDAKLRTELRLEIKKLHQLLKNTLIYVTHDQIEAMTLADRIAVMHNGKIEQIATPAVIYREPATRFVAEFIGSPAMNFVTGEVTAGNPASQFNADELQLTLNAKYPQGPAELGIRPESITPELDTQGEFTLEIIEYTGADCILWCKNNHHTWVVKTHSQFPGKAGDKLTLSFDSSQFSLFSLTTGKRIYAN